MSNAKTQEARGHRPVPAGKERITFVNPDGPIWEEVDIDSSLMDRMREQARRAHRSTEQIMLLALRWFARKAKAERRAA